MNPCSAPFPAAGSFWVNLNTVWPLSSVISRSRRVVPSTYRSVMRRTCDTFTPSGNPSRRKRRSRSILAYLLFSGISTSGIFTQSFQRQLRNHNVLHGDASQIGNGYVVFLPAIFPGILNNFSEFNEILRLNEAALQSEAGIAKF